MTYLLDTNVVSELRKRDPDSHVLAWYGKVTSAEIFVRVLTIGELRLGIERLRGGLHGSDGNHIIGVDADVAEEWGRLNVPDPLPVIDGLLAASAKTRGWTLVTRNTVDVARSGVLLLNPFDPPSST